MSAVEPGDETLVSPCLDSGKAEEASSSESAFLHDPGNGLRVTNVKSFLQSSFAQPVSEEERVFGRNVVIEILMTLLPEVTALVCSPFVENTILNIMKILWSRATSRICPTCKRLYSIGDELSPLISGGRRKAVPPQQLREQELSGLCELAFEIADSGQLSTPNCRFAGMLLHRII